MQNFNGNSDSTYYVYMYVSYPDFRIFYVGKGKGERWIVKHKRSPYFRNIKNKIESSGGMILPVKIWFTDDEQEAFDMEKYFYDVYTDQGHKLCNLGRPNGDGGPSGWIMTDEQKQKLSEIVMEKMKDPEMIARMKARRWMGDAKAKFGDSVRKRHLDRLENDIEYRLKIENSKKRKKEISEFRNTAEYKEQVSLKRKLAMRKVVDNPEYREKMRKMGKELVKNPEYIEKLSRAAKKNWQDPDYRRKVTERSAERMKDPDVIEKIRIGRENSMRLMERKRQKLENDKIKEEQRLAKKKLAQERKAEKLRKRKLMDERRKVIAIEKAQRDERRRLRNLRKENG